MPKRPWRDDFEEEEAELHSRTYGFRCNTFDDTLSALLEEASGVGAQGGGPAQGLARNCSWDSPSDLDIVSSCCDALEGQEEEQLHRPRINQAPRPPGEFDDFSDDLLAQQDDMDDFEDGYGLEDELQDDFLSPDSFLETLAPLGDGLALPLTAAGNHSLLSSFPSMSNLFSFDNSPAGAPPGLHSLLGGPTPFPADQSNPFSAAFTQYPPLPQGSVLGLAAPLNWGLDRSITTGVQSRESADGSHRPHNTLPVSTMILNSALQPTSPTLGPPQLGPSKPATTTTAATGQPLKSVQCMELGCQRRRLLAADGSFQYCRIHLLAKGGTPARPMCAEPGCERYARLSAEPNAPRRYCLKHMQQAGLTPLAAGPTCQHPQCNRLAHASSTGVKKYCVVHMGQYNLQPEGVVCQHLGCSRLATYSASGKCSFCVWHMREHGLQPMSRFVACEEPGCRRQSTLSSSGVRRYCRAHLKAHGLQPMQDMPCSVPGCERQAVRGASGVATGLCRPHAREAGLQLQGTVACAEPGCTRVAQYSTTGVRMYCDSHMRAHGQQPRPTRVCKHPGCTAAARLATDGSAYCKEHMEAAGVEAAPTNTTRKRCRVEGCTRYAQPSDGGDTLCSTHLAASRSESPSVQPAAATDTKQAAGGQQSDAGTGSSRVGGGGGNSSSGSRSPGVAPAPLAPVNNTVPRSQQGKHKCMEEGCKDVGLKVKDGSAFYCKAHLAQHNLRAAPTTACKRCQKEGCTKWAKRSTTGVSLYCKAHMKLEGLQPTSSIKRCAHSGCTHAAKPDTSGLWLYCKGHMQLYGMWPRDYKTQASSRKQPPRAALLTGSTTTGAASKSSGGGGGVGGDAPVVGGAQGAGGTPTPGLPTCLPPSPPSPASVADVSVATGLPSDALLLAPVLPNTAAAITGAPQQPVGLGAAAHQLMPGGLGAGVSVPSLLAGLDLGGPHWDGVWGGVPTSGRLSPSLALALESLGSTHATVGSSALLAPDYPLSLQAISGGLMSQPVAPLTLPTSGGHQLRPRGKVLLDLNQWPAQPGVKFEPL